MMWYNGSRLIEGLMEEKRLRRQGRRRGMLRLIHDRGQR